MTLIHAPADSAPVWPYDLADLRRDNPNVSFSISPTLDDLAPFGVFEVVSAEPPPCDLRSQRLEEAQPELNDGVWAQRWTVRDATAEEVADYDAANQPPPDWARFKRVALGSDTLNAILATAYQSVPVAAGALASALLRAESGDCADFAAAWSAITRAVPVSSEVAAGFAGVARACSLPSEFVAALQPSPN
jgi:hypothetical protein